MRIFVMAVAMVGLFAACRLPGPGPTEPTPGGVGGATGVGGMASKPIACGGGGVRSVY